MAGAVAGLLIDDGYSAHAITQLAQSTSAA
jgi:hypothetical protein